MSHKTDKLSILWAIDPFSADLKLQTSVAWAIHALTRKASATVEPVYVIHTFYGIPSNAPLDYRDIQDVAERKLKTVFGKVPLKGVLPLKVITEPMITKREAVEKMIAYAKASKADLIVTGSHARSGPKRWFLGSFAETLSLRSDVPFIVVNPHWDRVSGFKDTLFPTDFSDESHEAYGKVLGWAHTLGSNITVFHKLFFPAVYSTELSWTAADWYNQEHESEKKTATKHAQRWVGEAKRAGVRADILIDDARSGTIAEAITQHSKKHPSLIAMAAQSGPARTVFLGSVTRQVLRSSCFPVWVIHPSIKNEAKKVPFSISEREIMDDLKAS